MRKEHNTVCDISKCFYYLVVGSHGRKIEIRQLLNSCLILWFFFPLINQKKINLCKRFGGGIKQAHVLVTSF